MRPEPTRRLVLGAAATAGMLGLAGCKGLEVLGPLPRPGQAVRTLEHAIAAEELMLARYQAAQGALSGGHASRVVAAIAVQHQAHLDQLRARLDLPQRLRTARPRPSPSVPPPAGGRHAILAGLAQAEAQASARLTAELAAEPAALAQLMACIGAAEAAHQVLLGHGRTLSSPAGTGSAGTGSASTGSASTGPAAVVRGARGQARRALPALQAALAAEQAASYGYGIAGAHLTGAKYAAAAADCVAHQSARDTLSAMISALGGQPRPAAIAYRLPGPYGTAREAASLAAALERQAAETYVGLVAVPAPGLRTFAADGISSCAVRAARWTGRSPAFPGLPPAR